MQGGREGGQGEYREFGLWTPNLMYLEKFGSIWVWSKSKLFGNQFGEIPTWAKADTRSDAQCPTELVWQ